MNRDFYLFAAFDFWFYNNKAVPKYLWLQSDILLGYGAKSIWPVINKINTIIQNIKKEEERIKDIIGIIFFSVFFPNPIIDNMIPAAVRKNVI